MFTRRPNPVHPTVALLCVAALLLTSVTTSAMNQSAADALATAMITKLGRTRGVCVIPRCDNGTLGVAMMSRSSFTVYTYDSDTAKVRAATLAADAVSQTGIRLVVDKSPLSAVPFADNFVDFIAMPGATDADLTTLPITEIVRTLIPGGKAYIGHYSGEPGTLTASTLLTWAQGAGTAATAASVSDFAGTWVQITKSAIAYHQDWTHRMSPNASNNLLSSDTSIRWPFAPRFLQKPYMTARIGSTVSGGGRIYGAYNEEYYGGSPAARGVPRFLQVYRSYNGQLLWTRDLYFDFPRPDGIPPELSLSFPMGVSFMVATDQYLYMMKCDSVVVLDGETGTYVRSIKFTGATGNIRWLGIAGTSLYALMGGSTYYQLTGDRIACYNLSNNTTSWVFDPQGAVSTQGIGVVGGRLFAYVETGRVVGVNATSGQQVWTTPLSKSTGTFFNTTTGAYSELQCTQQYVTIGGGNDGSVHILRFADGTVAHSFTRSNWQAGKAVHEPSQRLIAINSSGDDGTAINLTNFTVDNTMFSNKGLPRGCGPFSCTPDAIFGGREGMSFRFSDQQYFMSQQMKGGCDAVPMFTNGLYITTPRACGCDHFMGMLALAPIGSMQVEQAAVEAQRLERGLAYGNNPTTVVPDASDWPTHRANNSHSASVNVNVASSLSIRWTYSRPAPYGNENVSATYRQWPVLSSEEPTPPAVVGSRVYIGGTDGVLRCINRNNGTEMWRHATGGPIHATPTVSDGRVYVGSADGYAYCIEAHTGVLVWRFRGAPLERRINMYGHLSSIWPVLTGVLIHNGTAFFAAGYLSEAGTHVYALNARTGAIVWQNNTSGSWMNATARRGVAPCGYMTVVKGKLIVRSFTARNGIYDLATGELMPLKSGEFEVVRNNGNPRVRGREIGAIDSIHVFSGGELLFADNGEKYRTHRDITLHFAEYDSTGYQKYPELQFETSNFSTTAPAWDSDGYYYATGRGVYQRWSLATLRSTVASMVAAHGSPASWPNWLSPLLGHQLAEGQKPMPVTPTVWSKDFGSSDNDQRVLSLAVATNTMALTHGNANTDGTKPFSEYIWKLKLIDKGSGNQTAEIALPGEPLRQGIAIDRDGNVIVAMRDGSVLCIGGPTSVASSQPLPDASPQLNHPSTVQHWSSATSQSAPTTTAHSAQAIDPRLSPATAPSARSTPVTTIAVSQAPAATAGTTAAVASAADQARWQALRELMSAARESSSPTYRPSDTRWSAPRHCLPVAGASASSSARGATPVKTVDRSLISRWAPVSGGPQWITHDLGSVALIDAASIVWYTTKTAQVPFLLEVSVDGRTFAVADEGLLTGRGTNSALRTFVPQEARYVRLTIQNPSGTVLASIYEMGIHGSSDAALRAQN